MEVETKEGAATEKEKENGSNKGGRPRPVEQGRAAGRGAAKDKKTKN